MLSIQSISFNYDNKTILNSINFDVEKGKHIAVMGESGCGKSTLLKALYGLLTLNDGQIIHNETKLLGPEFHLVPGHPFMKYLSQDFDLMPYISSAQNVGAFLSNFYPEEKKKRTYELLEVVGMTEYAETHVRYLSGGQQQRIALARVLAKEPEILLLDEPFSQIDNFKKNELRYRLFAYLKQQQITCITATHDKEDVLAFADEILVMKNGKQVLKNTPKKLYDNPSNFYAASLFAEVNKVNTNVFTEDYNKEILLYPHEIIISNNSPIKAKVLNCYSQGNYYGLSLEINNYKLMVHSYKPYQASTEVGIKCSIGLLKKRANLLP